MMRIIVASRNPVKLQAAEGGFRRMFPGQPFEVRGVEVPSGVCVQPRSDAETLKGAEHRARQAARLFPDADYWVGIEGGIDGEEEMTAFAWVVVLSVERMGKARTGTFFLPPAVSRLVKEGKELGEADDIVFGRSNSKQENGAVGLLTADVIDRRLFYEAAVVLALIPFKNPDLYK